MTELHDKFRTALVTNSADYAGPAAVTALLEAGFRVLAHDKSFSSSQKWADFQNQRIMLEPISDDEPEEIIAEIATKGIQLSAIVSNDHFPAVANVPEVASIDELRRSQEALVTFPFRLISSAIPLLRENGGGNIVAITSNRARLPLSGGALPDSARAAANAMVRSLAVDCAKDGITVNAIAPNFLYSEAYYPKSIYRESTLGRNYVRDNVPIGRLAEPWEIGEVVAFLATAKTRFLTGAVIDFSGGWPYGIARPVFGHH